MQRRAALAIAVWLVGVGLGACGRHRANAASIAGNDAYWEENDGRAIAHHFCAVEHDPTRSAAWSYLGSAHHALLRPGRSTPENLRLRDFVRHLSTRRSGTRGGCGP